MMHAGKGRFGWALAALVGLGALLLAGCGGGGDGGPAAEETIQIIQTAQEQAATTATAAAPTSTAVPSMPAAAEIGLGEQAASTLSAIAVIQSVEFHEVAEELAEATEVNPRLGEDAERLLIAARVASWPDEVGAQVKDVVAELEAFTEAVEASDLEGARAGAEMLHDVQHELLEASYEWLSDQAGKLVADDSLSLVTGMAALRLIGAADYHDLAEELAEATEVNPVFAETTGRALIAVRVTPWAPELQAAAEELVTQLTALEESLEAGDLAGAQAAAEAVHDAEHELTEAAYEWMGGHEAVHIDSEVLDMAHHMAVGELAAAVSFHDMAEELAEATEVNPRYADQVSRLITVVEAAAWPEEMGPQAEQFVSDLAALQAALEAGDLEAARTAAEGVHDSQHEFAESIFGLMGSMAGMMGHQ